MSGSAELQETSASAPQTLILLLRGHRHDIKVTEAHIDRLARLRLDTLALCDCGLEMTHLARLLPLGRSLQALDLSGNPGVGDVAL